MTIRELPAVEIEGHFPSGLGSPDHPMRLVTRRAAGLDDGGWTDDVRTTVGQVFDTLAADWHTRTSPARTAVVVDALDRGLAAVGTPAGLAVEDCSGIGTYSELLADRFGVDLAVDLSLEMLRRAPAGPGRRVQADASQLPLADGAAAAVVLINAFLFPEEVHRVLRADGVVVWVNSSGEETPIHLPADEVAAVLPDDWDGVASRAGAGTWSVLRRS
jgi:SAM-dependent methyltransferase